MSRSHVFSIACSLTVLITSGPTTVLAHGYINIPAARNVLANSDYCPQCLNAGGPAVVAGSMEQQWPSGTHGLCGDPYSDPTPRPHEAGGLHWTGKITANYTENQVIKINIVLTAYHKGRFDFRICKINGGTIQDEQMQLSENCFNENILVQADVPEAQNAGDRYYHIGTDATGNYNTYYGLPAGLTCDGVTTRCVLQWHYLTGNSCTPPDEPAQYLSGESTGGVGYCGSADAAYPEEFWNCADIAILTSSGGSSPTTSPPPSMTISPSPSQFAITNSPPLSPPPPPPPPPAISPLNPPVSPSPSSPSAFCATVGKNGYFADTSSACKSYYQCASTGSWRFDCPSGLLFNDAAQVCDWSYNVNC